MWHASVQIPSGKPASYCRMAIAQCGGAHDTLQAAGKNSNSSVGSEGGGTRGMRACVCCIQPRCYAGCMCSLLREVTARVLVSADAGGGRARYEVKVGTAQNLII